VYIKRNPKDIRIYSRRHETNRFSSVQRISWSRFHQWSEVFNRLPSAHIPPSHHIPMSTPMQLVTHNGNQSPKSTRELSFPQFTLDWGNPSSPKKQNCNSKENLIPSWYITQTNKPNAPNLNLSNKKNRHYTKATLAEAWVTMNGMKLWIQNWTQQWNSTM